MIYVWIDEFTPCLKDAENGNMVDTQVMRITKKNKLKSFNKRTGWYTNWSELLPDHEIYALMVSGEPKIQGLVALKRDDDLSAVYVAWMCAAPQNRKEHTKKQKYIGVGGHLFAVSIDKAIQYGYGGVVTGFAANKRLLQHYCETFHAFYLGVLHPFHFMIEENEAIKIKEMYTYVWTDTES